MFSALFKMVQNNIMSVKRVISWQNVTLPEGLQCYDNLLSGDRKDCWLNRLEVGLWNL